MAIPTGLVPLFHPPGLRPVRPQPPQDEGPEAALPPPAAKPAAKPVGARILTDEELERSRRRRFARASPETVAARRRFSDALGLTPLCGARACRRAGRCQGVGGAVCLIENDEVVRPALKALQEAPLPADDPPDPAAAPPQARRRAKKP